MGSLYRQPRRGGPQWQARIARARPHLGILQVTEGIYATSECRDVAIGHAIEALDGMNDLDGVREFVTSQLRNRRPATRRKAERFVCKYGARLSAGAAWLY
jgi:hypothetical protein